MAPQIDTRLTPIAADNDNCRDAAGALPTLAASAIALASGRGAALTLDPMLHMRVRLACALTGRSAQAIMTDALDELLRTMPGIERLLAETMAEGGDQAAAGWGLQT